MHADGDAPRARRALRLVGPDDEATPRDNLREAVAGATAPTAAHRVEATALAYARWAMDHPDDYASLFEPAGSMPWHGLGVVESIGEELELGSGVEAREAGVLAVRLLASVHGCVSVRLLAPEAPWATSLEREVRALVKALLPL